MQSILYIALIIVLFISFLAQSKVKRTFAKYSSLPASSNRYADEVAREMILRYGNELIPVEPVAGTLTDHYDPQNGIVHLSEGVYRSSSVSALAVAAHEIGHVMQHQSGYTLLELRNKILPVASLGSSVAPIIVIVGLLFGFRPLCYIGVILFGAVFLFQLVTLPMELNASKRGLTMLKEGEYIADEQMPQAKAVLRAAAMTYVLATIGALISFLRLILIVGGGSRRRD